MCFDTCIQKASAKIQVSRSRDYSCAAPNSPVHVISAAIAAGVLLLSGILCWAGEGHVALSHTVNTVHAPV